MDNTVDIMSTGYMTGTDLRRHRQRLGYSQPQLAEALRVSEMTVSRWERGLHRIPEAVALAILQVKPKAGAEPISQRDTQDRRAGGMPPRRARVIRADFGLTRRALGKRMGVDAATVARWETGAVPIPVLAAHLLACLYREHVATASRRWKGGKG